MPTPNRAYPTVPYGVAPDVPFWVNRALGEVDQDVNTLDADLRQLGAETGAEIVGIRSATEQSRSAAEQSAASAASAQGIAEDLVPRVGHIETMAGLAPGEVTDAQTANLIAQPDTLSSDALKAATVHAGMVASRYGLVGDSVADDGPALQALLDSAASVGAPVILDPGKTFGIHQRIQIPSGTRLIMHGAVLVNRMTASLNDALLWIDGRENVTIEGGTIDGDRANKPVLSEWQHGIVIQGASRNVTIRRVKTIRNNGDGVYVNGTATACPENITLDHLVSDNNVRQGLSVTGVRGLTDYASIYSNTNGKAPMAGIDLEPNTATSPLESVVFNGTQVFGNAGSGIDIAAWKDRTIRQGDIELFGVTVRNNARGVRLIAGDQIKFTGGTIRDNTSHGVWSSASAGRCSDVAFIGASITQNGGSGVRVDTGITGQGLTLAHCDLRNNTKTTAGVGVDLIPVVGSPLEAVTLIGNLLGGTTQTHALRTNVNVKRVTRVGNRYEADGAALSIGDEVATRYVSEQVLTSIPFQELQMQEAAPSNPSSTAVRVFSRKNTAGKDELCARFNSGAIVVIAGQP